MRSPGVIHGMSDISPTITMISHHEKADCIIVAAPRWVRRMACSRRRRAAPDCPSSCATGIEYARQNDSRPIVSRRSSGPHGARPRASQASLNVVASPNAWRA